MFDIWTPEFHEDPYAIYRRLREHAPIYYWPEQSSWVLTRYADLVAVLRDSRFGLKTREAEGQRTTNSPLEGLAYFFHYSQQTRRRFMALQNPPQHTRLRSVLHHVLSLRQMTGLAHQLQPLVNNLLDRMQDQAAPDLMVDVSIPLTLYALGTLLGVAEEDWAQMDVWGQDVVYSLDIAPNAETLRQGLVAILGLTTAYRNALATSIQHPPANVISALAHAVQQELLSEEEAISQLTLLTVAGMETTRNFIGLAMLALMRHPEQFRLLQTNLDLLPNAIEELIRFDAATQMISRVALVDAEVNGVKITKDTNLYLVLAAGNRDPAQFQQPDLLDIRREQNRHLSFSQGIHYCFGAPLARLVSQIAIGALVQRFPQMALATNHIEWLPVHNIRGIKSLRVSL